MSKINNSYHAILGILSIGPMSGYQIRAWVDEGVGYFWEIDYKQIYTTLKRLVAEGLATFEVVKTSNRPESKIYKLTEQGIQKFRKWLLEPVNNGKYETNELMLKLFFGHNVPVEINLKHIKEYKASKLKAIQIVDELAEYFENNVKKDSFWYYRMATIIRSKMEFQSEIDWCDTTAEYLKTNIK